MKNLLRNLLFTISTFSCFGLNAQLLYDFVDPDDCLVSERSTTMHIRSEIDVAKSGFQADLSHATINRMPLKEEDASETVFQGFVTHNKLQYAIFGDGMGYVATLIGWIDNSDYYPHIVVPDFVNYNGENVPVTGINHHAFYNGYGITGLTLGKNVVFIDSGAFFHCSIEEVVIPSTVRYILEYAFAYTPLSSIVFENASSTTSPLIIGDLAFRQTKLTEFEIPARLKISNEQSFTKKFRNPWADTYTLKKITINQAFYEINRNYTLYLHQNALCMRISDATKNINKSYVIAFPSAAEQSEFSLEDDYVDIWDMAFVGCNNLKNVSLTANAERHDGSTNLIIGTCGFNYSGLTSLSFYANGPIRLLSPFTAGCYDLQEYVLSESISNYKVFDGILYAKKNNERVLTNYPAGKCDVIFTVPEDVVHIANWAFSQNRIIKRVSLPDGLSTIGEMAFFDCSNLEEINYHGHSITEIGSNAFNHTKFIDMAPPGEILLDDWLVGYSGTVPDNLVISSNVAHSIDEVFQNTFNLVSVTFPKNFEHIPDYMFSGCTGLRNVILPNNLKTIGKYSFYRTGKNTPDNYEFSSKTVFPEGLTAIGEYAFADSRLMYEIDFPSSLEKVGSQAFNSLNPIREIVIRRNTPPVSSEEPMAIFNEPTLDQCKLIIPKDASATSFSDVPEWNFRNIVNGDFSGIKNIAITTKEFVTGNGRICKVDGTCFDLYRCDGLHLGYSSEFFGLNNGIYIVVQGNTVCKVLVK